MRDIIASQKLSEPEKLISENQLDSEKPGFGNETCFRSMMRYLQYDYYYVYESGKDVEQKLDEDVEVLSHRWFLLTSDEDQEEEWNEDAFDRRMRVEKKLFRKLMNLLGEAGFEPEDFEEELEAHLRNNISHAFYEMLENPDEPWQTWFIRLLPQ